MNADTDPTASHADHIPSEAERADMAADDFLEMLDALGGADSPHLIGVRHHSPALARAIPRLLEDANPEVVLVELPKETGPWLGYLADPLARAPLALTISGAAGIQSFYPFADFSPELAAIRWAQGRDIPVVPCDLPVAYRDTRRGEPYAEALLQGSTETDAGELARLWPYLMAKYHVRDHGELWDRMIEDASPGASAEQIRRSALAFGLAQRIADGPTPEDAAREAWMRQEALAWKGSRAVAVLGSFHCGAFLAPVDTAESRPSNGREFELMVSLVPYAFELFDSRSGYPAGIPDPAWRQYLFENEGSPEAATNTAALTVARIAAAMREDQHTASTADVRAAHQLMLGLCTMRGLAAPGRTEILEALSTTLGQGQEYGRSRAVAKAADQIMVGRRRGRLSPSTPRSGLGMNVEASCLKLSLPGPADPKEAQLRLEPHRRGRDQGRHLLLQRLNAIGIDYARQEDVQGIAGTSALGASWRAQWTPGTAAGLEIAGIYGPDLATATAGALRARWLSSDEDVASERISIIRISAECALPELVKEQCGRLATEILPGASLPELLACHGILTSLTAGSFPGLAPLDPAITVDEVLSRAVAVVPGLAGSNDISDARSLIALTSILATVDSGRSQLGWQLERLVAEGSPLISATASGLATLLEIRTTEWIASRLRSWLGARPSPEGTARLQGITAVLATVLESGGELTDVARASIATLEDSEFWPRLPMLRGGFSLLSPIQNGQLLDAILPDTEWAGYAGVGARAAAGGGQGRTSGGRGQALETDISPEKLAANVAADQAGRLAVEGLTLSGIRRADGLTPEARLELEPALFESSPSGTYDAGSSWPHGISELDRWRLILGRQRDQLAGRALRAGRSLDELYGQGEGARDWDSTGGPGVSFPSAREWSDELEDLFGGAVREQVLAASDRLDAILELDPATVEPSVDLLEQILALSGALPESKLVPLRRLASRIIERLAAELATRLRPALTGLASPRPTRRPTGRLHLPGTIRANLAGVRRRVDGTISLSPEHPVFTTATQKRADWHVVIVVDTSGSMERSTIFAALTAAILHGIPALSVQFVAFSTEVIDLTDRVSDPLALLTEISVGGGTDIGQALEYARGRLRNPTRSIVALITDFEEGVSPVRFISQVRALAETGAHLVGLAALDDRGAPVFSPGMAAQAVAAGMPVAALSPGELAGWIGDVIRSGGKPTGLPKGAL